LPCFSFPPLLHHRACVNAFHFHARSQVLSNQLQHPLIAHLAGDAAVHFHVGVDGPVEVADLHHTVAVLLQGRGDPGHHPGAAGVTDAAQGASGGSHEPLVGRGLEDPLEGPDRLVAAEASQAIDAGQPEAEVVDPSPGPGGLEQGDHHGERPAVPLGGEAAGGEAREGRAGPELPELVVGVGVPDDLDLGVDDPLGGGSPLVPDHRLGVQRGGQEAGRDEGGQEEQVGGVEEGGAGVHLVSPSLGPGRWLRARLLTSQASCQG